LEEFVVVEREEGKDVYHAHPNSSLSQCLVIVLAFYADVQQ